MTYTYTLQFLSIAMILFIIALSILIRVYWPRFISKLNTACNDPHKKLPSHESRQQSSQLDQSAIKMLETEKNLPFKQCGDSNLVIDFFWQDRDLLWENRLN